MTTYEYHLLPQLPLRPKIHIIAQAGAAAKSSAAWSKCWQLGCAVQLGNKKVKRETVKEIRADDHWDESMK